MAIIELKVEVAISAVPTIEDLLAEQEEQQLMVLEDKPASRAWVTGYFDAPSDAEVVWARFLPHLDPQWLKSPTSMNQLADKDWKESYKEHFKPWKFGRLNWVPIWEQANFQLMAGEEVLWLDPGMAFGTGNHETTRLVVERLVSLTAEHGNSGRVIDAGCGSGILALSAIKLGYERVDAFDNDPAAVDVARENAVLNGLGGAVDFYVGDLISGLDGRTADLVMANIQADVLMRFSRELLNAVAPGGGLVLSGILASELSQVREVFAAAAPGWGLDSRVMGEWSDLVLIRN